MAYVVPKFPLAVAIWRNGNPTTNPPDVLAFGNLTPGRRVMLGNLTGIPAFTEPVLVMQLLLPKLTDIRGFNSGAGGDVVEVPVLSNRFYEVLFVDDIGKGFANEHRFGLLTQAASWPSPIP